MLIVFTFLYRIGVLVLIARECACDWQEENVGKHFLSLCRCLSVVIKRVLSREKMSCHLASTEFRNQTSTAYH